MLSNYRAAIEDGRDTAEMRSRVEAVFGQHSQEMSDCDLLIRLRAFKISKGLRGTQKNA
jgi:hypothetical protein